MKTTFDAVDIIWSYLNDRLSISVYKFQKPSKEENEYITINSLPVSSGILQRCYLNVNIHVKDIQLPDSTTVPDNVRLGELAAYVMGELTKVITGDFHFHFESQGLERNEALKEHYVNIKLLCNILN